VHDRTHRVKCRLPKVDKTGNQATSRCDWMYTFFPPPISKLHPSCAKLNGTKGMDMLTRAFPLRTPSNAPPPLPPRKPAHLQQHQLPLVHGGRVSRLTRGCLDMKLTVTSKQSTAAAAARIVKRTSAAASLASRFYAITIHHATTTAVVSNL
jgi:hypothetical protein